MTRADQHQERQAQTSRRPVLRSLSQIGQAVQQAAPVRTGAGAACTPVPVALPGGAMPTPAPDPTPPATTAPAAPPAVSDDDLPPPPPLPVVSQLPVSAQHGLTLGRALVADEVDGETIAREVPALPTPVPGLILTMVMTRHPMAWSVTHEHSGTAVLPACLSSCEALHGALELGAVHAWSGPVDREQASAAAWSVHRDDEVTLCPHCERDHQWAPDLDHIADSLTEPPLPLQFAPVPAGGGR